MHAAERGCINSLRQALDLCDRLDPLRGGGLGVAVDVYHTWWDPELDVQIARAAADRLLAFHVCDWLVPTTDMLNDRGMMGDGIIDIRAIRCLMEAAGYCGYAEVELLSERWWQRPMDEVIETCIARHKYAIQVLYPRLRNPAGSACESLCRSRPQPLQARYHCQPEKRAALGAHEITARRIDDDGLHDVPAEASLCWTCGPGAPRRAAS